LKVTDELRAITNSQGQRDNAVMISSAIPSEKKSCLGSPLMLVKASTATEGLSGGNNRVPIVHEL
jgi:hypothetical protein